jgi:hypothetical protein
MHTRQYIGKLWNLNWKWCNLLQSNRRVYCFGRALSGRWRMGRRPKGSPFTSNFTRFPCPNRFASHSVLAVLLIWSICCLVFSFSAGLKRYYGTPLFMSIASLKMGLPSISCHHSYRGVQMHMPAWRRAIMASFRIIPTEANIVCQCTYSCAMLPLCDYRGRN